MWNFSNRGLIIIYPQDLLGYKKCSSTVYFFRSVKCYLVFHSFWDKEQNFTVSQNRPSHHCKLSLKATLSCILTANSCWNKKSSPSLWPWVHLPPADTGTYRPCWEAQGEPQQPWAHSTYSSLQQGRATHWELLTAHSLGEAILCLSFPASNRFCFSPTSQRH